MSSSEPPAGGSDVGASEAKPAAEPPAGGRSEAKPAAEIEENVRAFLADHHPRGRRGIDQIAPSDNLWRVVDSLNLLLLVEFIEAKFAIQVAPIDFAPQHFSTIASISKFVALRSATPAS
ncbi:MAG TPA: acyl carrier protein [Kofleriaceae bacterium]